MITLIASLQTIVFLLVLLATVKPLGWYMAKVYEGKDFWLNRIGNRFELFIYQICRIKTNQAMDWKYYLTSMLIFNLFGFLALYLIQRLQIYLPFNPQQLPSPAPDLALNTAISFATNTNWQAYSGETTMSYFTQMLALTTQNFISAATGMSLLVAISRGIAQHESTNLGNFWVDMVRSILYILLPLSFIFALILVSQGVIQNIKPNQTIQLVQASSYQQPLIDASKQAIKDKNNTIQTATKPLTQQIIPMGPVASQIAIKQLGTNGGGFFNTNSAHPFENPTPLSNFLEMLAILLIPAALCYTFGQMVHDKRQGWAILTVMFVVFIPFVLLGIMAEQKGNPALTSMGISPTAIANSYPGGNMEGKETRFGITSSALWSIATTAGSNGSVNSMLDSYTPLGGLIPLWMMHLNEAIFGGVGSGLYGMLMFVILTVFITGLMVGRTPEYLGKKIEPYEMKMASIAVLIMPLSVLISTALAVVTQGGTGAISNPGMHGFTEVLYTFTSIGNNNGSAFSGLNANTPFYNLLGSLIMLISRYWIAIATVALAGSLAKKKIIPQTTGTLATHTPLFIVLVICIIFLIGALSFLPALALGPIVEHLTMWGQYGS
ncbi:MAG: Potassium-transporting ATPase potassium-binding subunit [Legionella sp.]|uniref:potassium-transporting ATPase subunit KdpA n=1 Tax=Legionella sp. TaxID=459 RepID=UPI003D11055E